MFHVCFAIGMADFMPDEQHYHSAADMSELLEMCMTFIREFQSENPGAYVHFLPTSARVTLMRAGDASSLNWRLAIAWDSDRVLDVIGMTESEWFQESREA